MAMVPPEQPPQVGIVLAAASVSTLAVGVCLLALARLRRCLTASFACLSVGVAACRRWVQGPLACHAACRDCYTCASTLQLAALPSLGPLAELATL
eukprot:15484936-Alexandrium_andersonii.AAC.1